MLEAVLQSSPPVLVLVACGRLRVDPHLAIDHADGEAAHIVGEGVEGAAAGEIKAGVVPVAGEDAVFDAAPVEGEAHVGTAVVDGVYLTIVVEDGDGVAAAGDHGAAALPDLLQRASTYVSLHFRRHSSASLPGDVGRSRHTFGFVSLPRQEGRGFPEQLSPGVFTFSSRLFPIRTFLESRS